MSKLNTPVDLPYVLLMQRILDQGADSDDRTGVGTMSLFGEQMHIDISGGKFPAPGVRRGPPRYAFEELMFMLNGKTQTKELEEKGIKIWQGNTTREFLDKRGLTHLEEGDFGRMYGSQLRHFVGTKWNPEDDSDWDLSDGSEILNWFDQLKYIIDEIKNNPTSRRIVASQFNPAEAEQGALYPCHLMIQVNIDPRTNSLDLLFWMRSSDVGFGLPINIMYYAFFAHMLAKLTGYNARKLTYQSADCHIYKDQIESGMIKYMIDNFAYARHDEFGPPATIEFLKDFTTMEEMLELKWEDVKINGYEPFPDFKDKPKMAV